MANLSRRQLLRAAALGLGAVAVEAVAEACGSGQTLPPGSSAVAPQSHSPSSQAATGAPSPPAPAPATGTPAPAGHSPSASAVASPTSGAGGSPAPGAVPDLVVVRGGEPEALVRQAIGALGGMEKFVAKGAKVVVKPNVCVAYRTYEYAATTNPWVVGTLVKMALEAGAASVKVMDYPYGGEAGEGYRTSGIAAEVEAAGGQMVVMSSRKYVSTRIPAGKWLKETEVYEDILKADVIINAPIAKVHSSARMTAAMKGLMGVVRDRQTMHGELAQAIADLNTLIKPKLTVIDAVRVLLRNGPGGGRLSDVKKLDTVIAGVDAVAADAYVTRLLGLEPGEVDYIGMGAAMGLGRADLSKVTILELSGQ